MSNTVHIAAAINKRYLPYFSVMVSSVFRHRDTNRSYIVHVLSANITPDDLKDAVPYADDKFAIDLLDVSDINEKFETFDFGSFFGPECVYRLSLGSLLPDVEKIVYLDADLVVLDDISKLFDLDLGQNILGAVRDIGTAGMVSGYAVGEAERLSSLGIPSGIDYFNSGVLLMDLAKMKDHVTLEGYSRWSNDHQPSYPDQDFLNSAFAGSVLFLPMEWNVLFDSEGIRVKEIASWAPQDLLHGYLEARLKPSIFHYAGPLKPWMQSVDGSVLFWSEARFSPLYETVLQRYCSRSFDDSIADALKPAWETFDDLYFKVSEGERIRADLHRRLTDAEKRIDELQASVDELKILKTPLINKVYARIKK